MRDVTDPKQRSICKALVETKLQNESQAIVGTLADFRCEYCGLDFLDPKQPDNFHRWRG
jgi:hypothetical protein